MSETKPKPKKPRGVAQLLAGKCAACGARCQSACPVNCIEMTDAGEPIINGAKCIGCLKCVKVCPASAIEMYFTPEELKILEELSKEGVVEELDPEAAALAKYLAQYRGVSVFIEQTEGEPAKVSWELLGEGAKLAAKLGVELSAIVIGENVEHVCKEAFKYGASKAYMIDAPVYKYYRTESYQQAVCYLIDKYKMEVILMGATGMGRDLAGSIATVVATGLTADCTGLDIDDKRDLMQTRPAFGGNIMATIMCENTRPQMSTVRPNVMAMPARNENGTGEIIREEFAVKESDMLTKVLEIIHDSHGNDNVDVTSAEFIVSGGRGMMSKENFVILQELADEIDGVVGGSRSAIDAGWLPLARQVGQTGKTVRPKIYIACGISGAIQHLVGMQDSELVIAINRDPNAPIFEVATYGIVGDVLQIVPALTEGIRELKKQRRA